MTSVHPYSIPSNRSVLLSSIAFSPNPSLAHADYEIENMRRSENAYLLFTRHRNTNKHVVIKILRNFMDSRYSLGTISERQLCQLEALQKNRRFTQGVYLGLARICALDPERKRISLGEINKYPTREQLDPQAEYGLLMHELRKERRLDYLLKEGNIFSHQYYIQILAKYMEHMHSTLPYLPSMLVSSDEGVRWGSIEQLERKLQHNFSFINQSLWLNEDVDYNKYYKMLKDTLKLLKDDLLHVFNLSLFRSYFEQRLQNGRIRCCHGDLKTRNIWIKPDQTTEDAWKCVSVLDAVDFNPTYSNIDILSDFAMLVVDIQAHTKSSSLANLLIEEYLRMTKQQDKASRSVLAYYLVEKGLVGAIVNIIYDNCSGLGTVFLEVAKMRLSSLKQAGR